MRSMLHPLNHRAFHAHHVQVGFRLEFPPPPPDLMAWWAPQFFIMYVDWFHGRNLHRLIQQVQLGSRNIAGPWSHDMVSTAFFVTHINWFHLRDSHRPIEDQQLGSCDIVGPRSHDMMSTMFFHRIYRLIPTILSPLRLVFTTTTPSPVARLTSYCRLSISWHGEYHVFSPHISTDPGHPFTS